MRDREFQFEEHATCDCCGKLGAWDIYGDFICEKCFDKTLEIEHKKDKKEE